MERFHTLPAIQRPPVPFWSLIDIDDPTPVLLLTDEGRAGPSLNDTPHGVLASLAAAIHSKACHSGEQELRKRAVR